MELVIILSSLCLVYSQWHLGEEKEQTTTSYDTEDVSKPIPAQSPTQCILKCQRKLKEGYYVEEKSQCFCLEDADQAIYATEDDVGILYHQIEVLMKVFHFDNLSSLVGFTFGDFPEKNRYTPGDLLCDLLSP